MGVAGQARSEAVTRAIEWLAEVRGERHPAQRNGVTAQGRRQVLSSRPFIDQVTFRSATAEDAPALTRLEEVCFPDRPYPMDLILGHIRRGMPLLLAEAVPGLVAFAMVELDPLTGDGLLLSLDVHPGARRMGLATSLLGLVGQEVAGAGGSVVVLTVASRNSAARALYGGMGFTEEGMLPRYYGDDDAIMMAHPEPQRLASTVTCVRTSCEGFF